MQKLRNHNAKNYEAEEKIGGKTIKYKPLWKWLLE